MFYCLMHFVNEFRGENLMRRDKVYICSSILKINKNKIGVHFRSLGKNLK